MGSCVAYGCNNRPSKKIPGITFHRFPNEKERRLLWIKAVRRKNWLPSKYSRLCSIHFEESAIDRTSLACVRLRENAVPSIFPSHLQNGTEQLENWRKVIPRKDKIIGKRDAVCEKHFAEDDIIRFFETSLPDGNKFRLERDRPRLKKNAIPTIFDDLPKYSDGIKKIVKYMKSSNQRFLEKSHIILEEREVENRENTSLNGNYSCLTSPEKVETDSKVESDVEENFSYRMLRRNLESVEKPSVLWGITAHDTFIMCAKWTEKHALEKRVIVGCDLAVKVFIKDVEIGIVTVVDSIDEISTLLQAVENLKLS